MIYASLWLLVLCIMRIRPEVQTYISNNQDKNVSICHLSIDLHILTLLSRYVLCTIYFFAENCWFHIGQSQKFKIMFRSWPLSYHNSMVATVSPGWLCKHTISATIYIRFLEPQQERSSSRAMSECNVSIMFLTTLMYSYFCDHNVFNLWLPAVGLQILCK